MIAALPAMLLLTALAASAGVQPFSSLELGSCSLGPPQECFKALLCGLRPEDRESVRLLADGSVLVEGRATSSANFAALRIVARSNARTRLLILAPADRFPLRTFSQWPAPEPQLTSSLVGHPDDGDGFLGYTFFPFLGRNEPGIIYSPGAEVQAVVNSRQTRAALAETIFHEFRHVLAGEFGRTAPLAKHGRPEVEAAIESAREETARNAALCP